MLKINSPSVYSGCFLFALPLHLLLLQGKIYIFFLKENVTRNYVQEKQSEAKICFNLSCFIGVHDIFMLSQLVSSVLYLGYVLDSYILKLMCYRKKRKILLKQNYSRSWWTLLVVLTGPFLWKLYLSFCCCLGLLATGSGFLSLALD